MKCTPSGASRTHSRGCRRCRRPSGPLPSTRASGERPPLLPRPCPQRSRLARPTWLWVQVGSSYSYKIAFALQMVEKHSAASASSVLRPPPAAPRRPSRPLLMAETAVWVPYASPTHVRATASSTVDADLMVSVDGAGFASANLQDDASCSVDPSLDRHRPDACSPHSVDGAECGECAGE